MPMNEAAYGPDRLVVRSPEPVDAEVDGAVVMMSLKQGKYFGLDAVGTRIWQLLATPVSISELCDRLVSEFDVEPERCRRDVTAFLDDLGKKGLIEFRDGGAG